MRLMKMAKVKEIERLERDLKKSKKKISEEFIYAKDLSENLKRIENDDTNVAIKDLKKSFMILKWMGRRERKADKYLSKVLADLKAMEEILPADLKERAEKFLEELKITEENLEKLASHHVGEIKKDLDDVLTEEQLIYVYQNKRDPKSQSLKGALQVFFNKAEKDVQRLVKWVESVEAVLSEIEGFERFLQRAA